MAPPVDWEAASVAVPPPAEGELGGELGPQAVMPAAKTTVVAEIVQRGNLEREIINLGKFTLRVSLTLQPHCKGKVKHIQNPKLRSSLSAEKSVCNLTILIAATKILVTKKPIA